MCICVVLRVAVRRVERETNTIEIYYLLVSMHERTSVKITNIAEGGEGPLGNDGPEPKMNREKNIARSDRRDCHTKKHRPENRFDAFLPFYLFFFFLPLFPHSKSGSSSVLLLFLSLSLNVQVSLALIADSVHLPLPSPLFSLRLWSVTLGAVIRSLTPVRPRSPVPVPPSA